MAPEEGRDLADGLSGEAGASAEAAAYQSQVVQKALPLPWQLVREVQETDFAHPAEADLSRLLTFYRIRWSYEPTTFPLAFASDGRPIEMFTPDFYLPDHRLYIELTTMRQRLVTRKNRKIRQLRERYPNIRIKLLYRRDYDRLVECYRNPGSDLDGYVVGQTLFDAGTIQQRIRELAADLTRDLSGATPDKTTLMAGPEGSGVNVRSLFGDQGWGTAEPKRSPTEPVHGRRNEGGDKPLLIAVHPGSDAFMMALTTELSALGVDFDTDRITVTRFTTRSGHRRVRIRRGPRQAVAGRHIVLITDIVSTGLSLAFLTRWLRQRGAAKVDLCTLLDRRQARLIDLPLRYVGFEAPPSLLVGFGLQLRRQFEDLPFIAVLAQASGREIKPA